MGGVGFQRENTRGEEPTEIAPLLGEFDGGTAERECVVRKDDSEHRLWLSTATRWAPAYSLRHLFCGQKPCTHFYHGGIQLKQRPKRKRSIPLTFRVTEQDAEIIRRNAQRAGMNLTEYLTACAVGKNIVHIDGLNEFTRELKRQGANLNQLAVLVNMGRIRSVNVSETYDLFLDIHKFLKEILERKV